VCLDRLISGSNLGWEIGAVKHGGGGPPRRPECLAATLSAW
jgi:hypothetical protein